MRLVNEQGIVLRSYPFGEADRVVVLLSPQRGKIRAVAKGIRKGKSRFGGRLEPFTHVDVVLYEGRELYTVTQAAVIESFPHIRDDLDRVIAAATMVEVVDAVSQERESSVRLFLLLRKGLAALEAGVIGSELVASYLLKLAEAVGLAPALVACAACGRRDGLERFSFAEGGVLCPDCSSVGDVKMRAGLIAYLAVLAASDFGHLPTSDLAGEAMGVTRRFVEHHLDRRLQSLAALDG